MQRIDVAGMPVAYRRAGAGPPLVLLHGAVCDSRVWRAELEAFADAFDVVAWDAPGCGGSDDPPPSWRMSDFAACLAGFLERLALGAVQVLGHSWGSTVALELAGTRPDLVRSLVLVGGYAGWSGSLAPDEVARRLEYALAVAELHPGDFDPRTMRGLFSDAIPPARAEELAAIMRDSRPAGTRTMAVALAEADLRGSLGQVSAPTLLVVGEDDERSPVAVSEALQRALPDAELVVLTGAGHECPLEVPTAFRAAVRRFLLDH